MLRMAIFGFLSAFALFFCLACSVPLYKVAPIPQNISPEMGQTATSDGLEITAAALLNDEKSFERFDANWPLAGVIVVDIRLVNRTDRVMESIKFALHDAANAKFSYLQPKAALKRVMDFEGVQMYAIEGKKQTLEQLQSIALPKKISLAAQEEKRGVLFFDAKQDAARIKTFLLLVKEGKHSLTLKLP